MVANGGEVGVHIIGLLGHCWCGIYTGIECKITANTPSPLSVEYSTDYYACSSIFEVSQLQTTPSPFRISKCLAPGIGADTGPWLMPVQYERIARPGAQIQLAMASTFGNIA